MAEKKTVIITGASQGIGKALVDAFLEHGYNVVGTSRNTCKVLKPTENLVLVDGDIGTSETAIAVSEAALRQFGTIDVLVANAGIFFTKHFTEFTKDDFDSLVSTNLRGFFFITQIAVKQMLKQKKGSVVSISAALADQPISGVNAAVPMMTKGGIQAMIRSLAIEYARENIRFNAVAPGTVDTPMHFGHSKEALKKFQPMGDIVSVQDVADAVLYLAEARQVTGEILHVDGGTHAGRW